MSKNSRATAQRLAMSPNADDEGDWPEEALHHGLRASGGVDVSASLTGSINRGSPFEDLSAEFLRALVLSELAIEIVDPLVGHRLEHEIG